MWHSFSKVIDLPKALKALFVNLNLKGFNRRLSQQVNVWTTGCVVVIRIHLPAHKGKKPFFFFVHELCGLKDAVILQQFYHFLPADSAEDQKGCCLRCQITVIVSANDLVKMLSRWQQSAHHTAAFVGVRKTLWWCWWRWHWWSSFTLYSPVQTDDCFHVDTFFCLISVEVHGLTFECSGHF